MSKDGIENELLGSLHPNLLHQLRRAGMASGHDFDSTVLAPLLKQVDQSYRDSERALDTLKHELRLKTDDVRQHRNRLDRSGSEVFATECDQQRSVISALDHGLVAIDNDDEVLFVNAAAISFLGCEPLSGTSVLQQFSLFDSRTDELVTPTQIMSALTMGEPVTGATGFLHAAQSGQVSARPQLPVWASITPLIEDAEIAGLVLLFGDSSEHHETMDRLARALVEAQRATEAKSRFLATMSHEIRTPMNGVLGMLELVAHTGLDDQQRHWVSLARDSGDALLDIINAVLDFSKLEAGRTELERVSFDPAALAEDVTSLLAPRGRSNGLAVSVALACDLPPRVVGDPGRVRQVLINLVGNAIKFTQEGSVRLLVDRLDTATNARSTSATLRFVVDDTGTGIPSERLDDLFVPFNQLDVSTTRTHGGTGLGLTICRETVKLMGGNITVASEVGVGSSFAFTVPVQVTTAIDAEANSLLDAKPEDGAAARGPHLLVAEDNAINQILIKAILDNMGATYEVVADGVAAVEAALARPFSALLMDCEMPVLDGFDASRRIRAGGSTIPILALTANALAGDREACIEAGMNDHLAKPVKMAELRAALARLAEAADLDGRHGDR